jgi:hypothetical protein
MLLYYMVALAPSDADVKRFGDTLRRQEELELGAKETKMLEDLGIGKDVDKISEQIKNLAGQTFK